MNRQSKILHEIFGIRCRWYDGASLKPLNEGDLDNQTEASDKTVKPA